MGLRLPTYLVSLSCLGMRVTMPNLWDEGRVPFSRQLVIESKVMFLICVQKNL